MTENKTHKLRMLIAYPSFPEPDTAAGWLRIFEIIKILLSNGNQITFLAKRENDSKYRKALEDLGVICVSDDHGSLLKSVSVFEKFLRKHAFESAILGFYDIYNQYAPYIRTFLPNCHLILDTVDLHFLRIRRRAELSNEFTENELATKVELEESKAILHADSVWVVTNLERDILFQKFKNEKISVHVVPIIHRPKDQLPDYDRRHGIIFLGGYRHHPNVDGVHYFMKDILSLLRKILPDVQVTIAGSYPPDEFHKYAEVNPNLKVTGFIDDHQLLLSAHRVGIVPLRYGAGMKGKIGEYFACGLPCVSTTIGAEGMDLAHGREILVADSPINFASAIERIYHDRHLWESLSIAGLQYVRSRLSPSAVEPILMEAIRLTRTNPVMPKTGFLNVLLKLVKCLTNPTKLINLIRSLVTSWTHGGLPELWAKYRIWSTHNW